MATVTVVDAERTLEIEATSIVSGLVNSAGHLILTRHDGTDIDMGAVSGMQLDGGTSYSKVDAFTYVGDTDPGAVPNGSVWLDTNDVAGPFASDTQKGLVELATLAETNSLTDSTRAVTPAGLATVGSRLTALEVTKIQTLAVNAQLESALPTAYPTGISLMTVGTGSGWSHNSGFGSVVTTKVESSRTQQTFYANASSVTATPRMWIRYGTGDSTGWTSWAQVQALMTLVPANFGQITAISGYPLGWSRLIYTTANSTNWDFAGMAGEVLTYVDGTDFAKQTFTSHTGGSGSPVVWHRTANAANGWTAWQKLIIDPGGWTSYTPTWTTQSGANSPSLGNAVLNCKSTKKGRKVDVTFEITFGSTTNFGTAPTTGDNWQFTLPYAAANSTDTIGWLQIQQTNDKICMGRARLHSTTGFRISISSGYADGTAITNTGDVDSLSPFTWANGNSIKGQFTYESAA